MFKIVVIITCSMVVNNYSSLWLLLFLIFGAIFPTIRPMMLMFSIFMLMSVMIRATMMLFSFSHLLCCCASFFETILLLMTIIEVVIFTGSADYFLVLVMIV